MQHRSIVYFALLMLSVLVLASCGGGLGEDDAEETLRQLFEGDMDTANASLCEEARVTATDSLADGVVFKEVTCEQHGADEMICDATFETTTGDMQTIKVVFEVRDDAFCNFRVK